MSILVVGGVTIPVAPGGISRPRLDAVDRARAFDNTYRASLTGNPKRDFSFSTPPVTRANADWYESLLVRVNPVTCSGDIIGGSSNILLYSEQFDNAVWTKSAATVGANVQTAPNGTLTADKIKEDNTTAAHVIYQTVTCPTSVYTFSVFLVAGERSKAVISLGAGADDASIGVDLSNGTTFASGLATGAWSAISSTVTPYVNTAGTFYRVTVTGTRGGGAVTDAKVFLWTTALSYLGVTGNGLYAWGAQLEAAAAATSYTQTTSVAVSTLAPLCCPEITGWTPVKSQSGHLVVLGFTLHEV